MGNSLSGMKFNMFSIQKNLILASASPRRKKYLEDLGAKTIAEARAMSAEEIQKNTKGMGDFWPPADGVTVPENMYEVFKNGLFNDTPILVGSNSNEGGLFVTRKLDSDGFKKMVHEQYTREAEEILKVYPHSTEEEATQSAKDLMRESAFAWPTWAWAVMHTRNSINKVYVYYFDHRVPEIPGGANHADEIPYVFGNLNSPGPMGDRPVTEEDKKLNKLISSYWINFARTGDPNGEGLPEWPAFDEKENKVMYIDSDTGARTHPDIDKIMVFDEYYAKLREGTDKK